MLRLRIICVVGLSSLLEIACGGVTSDSRGQPDGGGSGASSVGGAAASGGSAAGGSAASGGVSAGGGVAAGGSYGSDGHIASAGGTTSGSGGRAGSSGGTTSGSGGRTGSSGGTKSASGGTTGEGGTCPSVSFHLSFAGLSPGSVFCTGPPTSCGDDWLTVENTQGTPVETGLFCTRDCADCSMRLCPPVFCSFPQPLSADGVDTTWDGETTLSGTCDDQACYTVACAAPGHYVAHLCGYFLAQGDGSFDNCRNAATTPTCVDVPFEYPTSAVVAGKLTP